MYYWNSKVGNANVCVGLNLSVSEIITPDSMNSVNSPKGPQYHFWHKYKLRYSRDFTETTILHKTLLF